MKRQISISLLRKELAQARLMAAIEGISVSKWIGLLIRSNFSAEKIDIATERAAREEGEVVEDGER